MTSPGKACMAVLCLAAVLLFVAGVSVSDGRQESSGSNEARAKVNKGKVSGQSKLDKAPQKARARRNPLENDPDAVAAGEKLFRMHCVECHGESAEGTRRAPNLRDPEVQDAPPGAIFWVLTNGIVWHGMPVWSKLPEPQRWQLVTYIRSLGTKPPTPSNR
jgi:mono/diheme cytochrome c family protein